MRMAAHNQAVRQSSSLTYSDSSFGKQHRPLAKPERNVPAALPRSGFAGLELSGDPITDAARLETLLQQLNDIAGVTDLSRINEGWPDDAMLTRMLINLGVNDGEAVKLAELLRQFILSAKAGGAQTR